MFPALRVAHRFLLLRRLLPASLRLLSPRRSRTALLTAFGGSWLPDTPFTGAALADTVLARSALGHTVFTGTLFAPRTAFRS